MFREDQRGFSFVEMLITVAIIAIVAGLSINLISHIGAANSEKIVQYISAAMSKVQVNAMKKSPDERPYLYIYSVDGMYYYLISSDGTVTLGKNGVELGSTVKIYKDSVDAANLVTADNAIKISYKKDGSFVDDAVDCFIVKGKRTTTFTLNKETGKHFMSD